MRFLTFALLLASGAATAAPIHYTIDPDHTYPSFAADHVGLSIWRGKFDHSAGTITPDRAARSGSVHIVTQVASIDFGNPALKQAVLQDVSRRPCARRNARSSAPRNIRPQCTTANWLAS